MFKNVHGRRRGAGINRINFLTRTINLFVVAICFVFIALYSSISIVCGGRICFSFSGNLTEKFHYKLSCFAVVILK